MVRNFLDWPHYFGNDLDNWYIISCQSQRICIFVIPSIAIWAADRTIRLGRLVSFGLPVADVALLSDDTIRVSVSKPNHWTAAPGGHAFVQFLRPTIFWQSHPFTFIETPDGNSIVFIVK